MDRSVLIIAWLVICTLPVNIMAKPPLDEYVVKTAFIFNFAKYIKWPKTSFADSSSPLLICVTDPDPFGAVLDELNQKLISDHPVEINRLTTPHAQGCHIVFSATENIHEMSTLFSSTKGQPILTIGDAIGFSELGGMINFYKEDEKLRFEINASAIKDSGLEINARLLQVARIVTPKKGNSK